jgi:hypothetical protein
MAWLKRELYSNSCGHTSCDTRTLTLFVSNFEALRESNTVQKVISARRDLIHCVGSAGRVQSATNEWRGNSEFMGSPNRAGIAQTVRTIAKLRAGRLGGSNLGRGKRLFYFLNSPDGSEDHIASC